MRRGRLLLTICLVVGTLGCEAFRSDAENFSRQRRTERARAARSMRAATEQTARGADVAGEALTRLVSGRTHVFEYGMGPSGRAGRYVEYSYFRPDGRFVYRNTEWATAPDGRDGDHWRVDGNRLCVLNGGFSADEHCYRLAVQPNARVQYYMAEPGTETDGLLTKITDRIIDGAPDLRPRRRSHAIAAPNRDTRHGHPSRRRLTARSDRSKTAASIVAPPYWS